MRRVAWVMVVASLFGGIGCGGDSSESTPLLRVDLIDAAIDQVADRVAGPVSFFEVNATPLVVNLFVASEGGTVQQFIFDGRKLVGPSEPLGAQGATFSADMVDFDPNAVLDAVFDELPDSEPSMFVINAPGDSGAASRVEYRILLRSSKGGELAVVVDRSGGIIGTDAE